MAIESADPSKRSAQDVGNIFVTQYYTFFFGGSELVYKFYEESSVLSRPGPNGEMTSATTIQGIKDLVLSLDFEGYKKEIKTVDAQDSCNEGVLVLVTGCVTGKDNLERSFTQTFFLAPHAKGYYVLNDVFRFVDVPRAVTLPVNDANEDVASTPLSPNEDNQPSQDHCAPTKVTTNVSSDKKASTDNNSSVVKEVVVSEQSVTSRKNDEHAAAMSVSNDQEDSEKISYSSMKNDGQTAAKSASNDLENSKKNSYASMVAKKGTVTSPTESTTTAVVAPSSAHQQQRASAPLKASALVKSIYVGNLPSDVSVKQLEAVFKKFGPIKKGGIQVRNFADGFCYGFVEFELSKSACSAIEAHNITVGSKEAYITEKKSTNQGKWNYSLPLYEQPTGNGRGRFSSEKSEVKNDNYRNQESFDGRGYGRHQNGNRNNFSGQIRGLTKCIGETHQKVGAREQPVRVE
ncbi:nuclear transport factor 2 (NTF2) family protein with RNA binding (RRM-RBD-RNP motifs) domain-containing protein [Actinidia rufa]|uniref:Nuclear transport factor 2 (NTF2) family protein with RNA binding (RRM-RBD-RNP motifs) domain-containing protein n=1 Tax=Actinidia rufa TaxID=165716 RepID=A0A7J0FNP1_9ERIC|nr:nuclear transport factor 2 (NTF2) family protein with RNA binding (RRM-RBD-RNP motifs) domain-containing protein [Actinidia rufa]